MFENIRMPTDKDAVILKQRYDNCRKHTPRLDSSGEKVLDSKTGKCICVYCGLPIETVDLPKEG